MRLAATLLFGLLTFAPVSGHTGETASLIRTPQCGCCLGYAEQLRQSGFVVTVTDAADLSAIKRQHGVPPALEGCHTTLVGGYVVEGHVPLSIVSKLLRERPSARGISLPGMPLGSPGMDGEKTGAFTVYQFADGAPTVFAVD